MFAELYKPNYLKLMNRATSYYSKALNFSRPGTTTATLATDPVLWGFVNTKDDGGAPLVTLNSVSAASKTSFHAFFLVASPLSPRSSPLNLHKRNQKSH